jgi:hypothetical protein
MEQSRLGYTRRADSRREGSAQIRRIKCSPLFSLADREVLLTSLVLAHNPPIAPAAPPTKTEQSLQIITVPF